MKFVFTLIFVLNITQVFAEVSKENVESMIDKMVKDEVISAKEAQKARIRLHSMNTKEWKTMNSEAHKVAARSPASVSEKTDLYSVQFKQIQDDVRKLAPRGN